MQLKSGIRGLLRKHFVVEETKENISNHEPDDTRKEAKDEIDQLSMNSLCSCAFFDVLCSYPFTYD